MGGSIAAMRASLKANERKGDRKKYFEKGSYFKNGRRDYKTIEIKKLYSKSLTKKEKARLKRYSRVEFEKEKLPNGVILSLTIILTLAIMAFLASILKTYYFKA